jgi:uncharacterized repeat protein (TIGR02543 family)
MKKIVLILFLALAMINCSKDDNSVISYTVTFDADGGTPVPSAQRVEEGSTVTAPSANPTKAGYVFVYWHLSGTTTAYNFQTPVNRDITLYAKWQEEAQAEYWQVTWELNGGSWPSGDNHSTQVLKGGTLSEPIAPTKLGNTFEGWYKESALTNKVTFPYDVTNVTGDIKLYAKWTTEGEDPGTFTAIAALYQWLKSQPENTEETPYKIVLKSVNLDAGSNWTDLGVVIFEAKTKYIELDLSGCTGIDIPDGRTEAGNNNGVFYVNYYGVFVNCDNLLVIKLPDSLKTIGKYAFTLSDNLTTVMLPANLETIGTDAFFSCDALATIALPAGLKTLGGDAFSQSGLTSITVPGSVTDFGAGVFMRCESLITITIEDGVKAIGADAFWRCSSLSELIMLCAVPPTLKVNTDGLQPLENTPATLKIKVPTASLNAYKTAAGWKDHASKIVANTN